MLLYIFLLLLLFYNNWEDLLIKLVHAIKLMATKQKKEHDIYKRRGRPQLTGLKLFKLEEEALHEGHCLIISPFYYTF
jgi:hypothetical protein